MKKLFFFFCIMAEIMSLNAQTIYYWNNSVSAPTGALWSSTSPIYFWNGSAAVPSGGEVIQFDGTAGLISTNDLTATNRFKINFYGAGSTVSRTLNGITTNVFYDYGGNHPIIQNWSGLLQTINFPFQIGNESTLNYAYGMHILAGSGDLNIGSTISAANATGVIKELVLTAGAAKNLTLSGVISDGSGAIKLAKWGAGTLYISGNNTYTGSTTVSDGTLKLGSSTALGSVTGYTTVNTGYTLDMNGITYANAEPLSIRGAGYSSAGAISNSSATAATFPGLLTLAAASTITGSTGTIALSNTGTITGAYDLTLDGNSGGSIASIIGTGIGNLIKTGTGIWKLSAINTYTGQTQINNGELWIESGGDINTASAIWLGNGGTLSTSAKIFLSSLSGGTTFARAINVNAGNSGTRIIGGQNTSGTNTFSGSIGSSQPLTVNVPNSGGTVAISGAINATSVTKTGYGTLSISNGSNSISGNWLVEQGTMSFSTFGGHLNGKPIVLGNATEVGTITYSGIAGNQTVPISTNAGGGKFNFTSTSASDLKLTSAVTQTIAGVLEVDCKTAKNLTLDYLLTGAGGIKVSSASTGALILSKVNTYSGTTTINAGTLILGATNAIPSGVSGVQSAVTINGGTFSTGATSLGFSAGTSTYPMGILTVGAVGGAITLAATSASQNLYFANSSGATWGGGILTITGWAGTIGNSGTNGHIYVGATTGTLTSAQLAKITFSGIAGSSGAMLLSTGELVPASTPPAITSFSAAPNNGTSTTGYIGSTVTITGTNFTGATKVTIGGTDLSCSVTNSTTLTFAATSATGTITVTTATGGTSVASSSNYANAGYITTTTGNWSSTGTWLGSDVPTSGAVVTIANNTILNQDATIASILINGSSTLTGSDGSPRMLSVSVSGTFTNNGTFTATNFGTVNLAGSATITGVTTFNNLTLNGTTTLNNAPTVNGTITMNSGAALVSNSPIYGASSTLNYNLSNGFGAKYNQALEWPATSGPTSVLLTTNSWVQMTGDRSLTGNLTVTSGALQATGALRTLTMNGTTQTITVSTTTGGAIYGTDNGVNNDLQLTVANGSSTTFTGDATSTDDDEKKFLNIAVNSGGTLALARGILCKWGTFTVNGTLKINANGYIQSNNTSNSAPTTTNKAADYSGGGTLVYNNGGPYSTSDKEWPTTNSPANVTIQNSGTNVGLNNSKTISGILTLTDGTLTTDANTLTIAGTIAATSGLINTGVTGTLAFAGTSEQILSSSELTSASVNILTINAGSKLTTSGTIAATTLNILSDGNGTGTLKDGGSLTATTANVNQYLTSAATGNTGRNWYVSSPVSAAVSSTITTETGNGLVSYNVGTGLWDAAGTTMEIMKGYIAKSPAGNHTIVFSGGIINNGPQTVTNMPTGFNLVGNPYPSYVTWDEATKTGVSTSIWYRSKKSGSYLFQTYNSAVHTGTLEGTTLIPPMQAFWVKTTSATNTVGFDNSMRSHQDQSDGTLRLKAPAATNAIQQVLRLEVSNAVNIDEAIVLFNANASNDFDNYDSQKMTNNNTAIPEIYTTVGSEQLVINGLKNIQYNTELPLGFSTGESGTNFSIKASEVKNFDAGTQIILRDYLNSNNVIEKDLSDGSAYSFNSDVATTATRFALVFKAPSITTDLNNGTDELNVRIYRNENNQITVNRYGSIAEQGIVTVCNAIGQKIISTSTTGTITLISKPFSAGVYFVVLNTSRNKITKKLIIN